MTAPSCSTAMKFLHDGLLQRPEVKERLPYLSRPFPAEPSRVAFRACRPLGGALGRTYKRGSSIEKLAGSSGRPETGQLSTPVVVPGEMFQFFPPSHRMLQFTPKLLSLKIIYYYICYTLFPQKRNCFDICPFFFFFLFFSIFSPILSFFCTPLRTSLTRVVPNINKSTCHSRSDSSETHRRSLRNCKYKLFIKNWCWQIRLLI